MIYTEEQYYTALSACVIVTNKLNQFKIEAESLLNDPEACEVDFRNFIARLADTNTDYE